MSLLLPVAAIMLSIGSVLILRAVWSSDAEPRHPKRSRRTRKPAYDPSLRRAA